MAFDVHAPLAAPSRSRRAGRPRGVARPTTRLGLHRSQRIVARLSALFALDAFGGGFVIQSFIAFWFDRALRRRPRGARRDVLRANILAGVSALAAARLAARFGLMNTMVFTHLPSNVLLILVPLMPTLELAVARAARAVRISQMDVPTRQSYTMAVVDPDERSAAAGVTGIARSLGARLAAVAAAVPGPACAALPFVIAGGLKIVYDLLLYREFRSVRPPEERETANA